MPRLQVWAYTCDNCGSEIPLATYAVQLELSGDLYIFGPDWYVYAADNMWFCSPQCLLSWLTTQIEAATKPDRTTDGSAAEYEGEERWDPDELPPEAGDDPDVEVLL
jgi:hypothetical protein